MKRIFILVVVTLFAVGSMFAEQRTLIDFSLLTADITVNGKRDANGDLVADANGDPVRNQNGATLVDFSNEASGNFTARQKRMMYSSLAIENWDVVFASSSRNVTTKEKSYTKQITSKTAFGGQDTPVMGVRIHFPVEPFSSWAAVKPPFVIPAFEPQVPITQAEVTEDAAKGDTVDFTGVQDIRDPLDQRLSKFEGDQNVNADANGNPIGLGLIKNVGTIKSIAVNVYGLNFPHSLSIILIDDKGVEKTYFMGYLNFDGWGELRWDNPMYIQEVRNRELRVDPIYPDSTPYVKFGGFLVQKAANAKGGDFVGYFKDVQIVYDQAVLIDPNNPRDINDEDEWGIIKDRDENRRKVDLQRLGQIELQRTLDRQRQAAENQVFGPNGPNAPQP